jgi:hypothetical protein
MGRWGKIGGLVWRRSRRRVAHILKAALVVRRLLLCLNRSRCLLGDWLVYLLLSLLWGILLLGILLSLLLHLLLVRVYWLYLILFVDGTGGVY